MPSDAATHRCRWLSSSLMRIISMHRHYEQNTHPQNISNACNNLPFSLQALHDGYAAVKQVFGGEITSYTELLTEARTEALERLAANAGKSLKSRALFFGIGPTFAKAACFVHVSPS
tara:strand:+ start:641 stop:991 length:351 start_codon:yes stop_codon:yes gene_type:complete